MTTRSPLYVPLVYTEGITTEEWYDRCHRHTILKTAHHEAGHAVVAWATWVEAGRPAPMPWEWMDIGGARAWTPGLEHGTTLGQVTLTWPAYMSLLHRLEHQGPDSDAISMAGQMAEIVMDQKEEPDLDWFAGLAENWMDDDPEWFRSGDGYAFGWKGSNRQKRRTRERRLHRAAIRAHAILVEHRTLWLHLTSALLDADYGLHWTQVHEMFGEPPPPPAPWQ